MPTVLVLYFAFFYVLNIFSEADVAQPVAHCSFIFFFYYDNMRKDTAIRDGPIRQELHTKLMH